jgi:TonB family protein
VQSLLALLTVSGHTVAPLASVGAEVALVMFSEVNEPQINFDSIPTTTESRRRVQLLVALALLLVALILLVIKNGQFWSDILGVEELAHLTNTNSTTRITPQVNSVPTHKTAPRQSATSSGEPHVGALTDAPEPALSPLQVDITYSSGQHQTIVARDTGIHIDLKQNPNNSSATAGSGIASGSQTGPGFTGARVRFSGQTMEIVGHPVEPIYPLQAQQENVQGAVVLQAQVGEDGNVQALKVISGPPMLTSAALEAVKQWHFKPHQEGGKAVPRETRITVNFAISTQ